MEIKRKTLDQFSFFAFIGIIVFLLIGPFTLVVIDNADPNSMYPTYQQGDLFILSKPTPDKYELGDVVVYQKPSSDTNVIHRIIDIGKLH